MRQGSGYQGKHRRSGHPLKERMGRLWPSLALVSTPCDKILQDQGLRVE